MLSFIMRELVKKNHFQLFVINFNARKINRWKNNSDKKGRLNGGREKNPYAAANFKAFFCIAKSVALVKSYGVFPGFFAKPKIRYQKDCKI